MSADVSTRPDEPAVSHPAPGTPFALSACARAGLLTLLTGAAVWVMVSSVLGLTASIKFHSPGFLAEPAWLTYGRVRPAAVHALIYGFAIPGGLAIGLWLMARLGRCVLPLAPGVAAGAALWHAGVLAGLVAILAGEGSGVEYLEFPAWTALLLFLGYIFIGASGVLAYRQRVRAQPFVSQWFLLAAWFWFPWIFSSAALLLLTSPVRGVTQAVIGWWYAASLLGVWFGLVGLAVAFYLTSRVLRRELNSHYLALFVFWVLILFGGLSGVPSTAPVPAWLPALSTVATVMGVFAWLPALIVTRRTTRGALGLAWRSPALRFVLVGVLFLALSGIMGLVEALAGFDTLIHLTWFGPARAQFNSYGYFCMVIFGGIYFVLPRLSRHALPGARDESTAGATTEDAIGALPFPRLAGLHFWLAFTGAVLAFAPLAGAGILQASKLLDPSNAFVDVARSTLMFLRLSTVGDLLLLGGHTLLLVNVAALVAISWRARLRVGLNGLTALPAAEGGRA